MTLRNKEKELKKAVDLLDALTLLKTPEEPPFRLTKQDEDEWLKDQKLRGIARDMLKEQVTQVYTVIFIVARILLLSLIGILVVLLLTLLYAYNPAHFYGVLLGAGIGLIVWGLLTVMTTNRHKTPPGWLLLILRYYLIAKMQILSWQNRRSLKERNLPVEEKLF